MAFFGSAELLGVGSGFPSWSDLDTGRGWIDWPVAVLDCKRFTGIDVTAPALLYPYKLGFKDEGQTQTFARGFVITPYTRYISSGSLAEEPSAAFCDVTDNV